MQRAIFLVRSVQGIRKPTFRTRLISLINSNYQIVVLLAMTNFDDIWRAQREFQAVNLGSRQNIRVISLADIYADQEGIALKATDYLAPDFSSLKSYDSHSGKLLVTRFVDEDGNIVAESLFSEASTRLHTILFDKNSRIIQINNYDSNDHLFGIEKYANDFLDESLLLNASGQLVFRFTNYLQSQKTTYNITDSSVVPLPAELTEVSGQKDDQALKDYEAKGVSTITKATSYTNYRRYDDINAFYHQVLLNMDLENAQTYVDIDHLVEAAKYLPGKRIFNY
ncbi:hypothetical protein [Lentilactobacillus kisonensis]|uniref:Uncharacterized protein n=1 Tax=Lentilactobacillus kisonensis DSM 19906 = JCM 15041 TaxID=1423766 RepID=A0A0R1NJX3_9LACO|nr:hypothetical protein [Lentilactobacillus kisonensis]KRL20577.1 hypothetical protein FC98_GL001357 [Lentilactobacillus kisonensis DSM 19906 = JCM 15041]